MQKLISGKSYDIALYLKLVLDNLQKLARSKFLSEAKIWNGFSQDTYKATGRNRYMAMLMWQQESAAQQICCKSENCTKL